MLVLGNNNRSTKNNIIPWVENFKSVIKLKRIYNIYKEEEEKKMMNKRLERKLDKKGSISYSIVCHKALYIVSIYRHPSTSWVTST